MIQMPLEILSLTEDLNFYGGAQKVLMDVHEGIRQKYTAKVVGLIDFKDLHPKYKIKEEEYIKLTNPFFLNNKILIVHCRNYIAKIMILKHLLFLNTKVLYVSHNVYNTHRWLTFFPDDIISISEKVTHNIHSYFRVKNKRIRLIYNGIKDEYKPSPPNKKDKIIILYLARVNGVKRQLKIVDNLAGKLSPKIEIQFGGTGEDYEQLVQVCKQTKGFSALGFIENVGDVIRSAQYLMLFSSQEGLSISLLEGVMYGKPLLVNDVGGNLEIGIPGKNAIFLNDDWNNLADQINNLVSITESEYESMSVNSRMRYENMFTYNKMIANYAKVIEEL